MEQTFQKNQKRWEKQRDQFFSGELYQFEISVDLLRKLRKRKITKKVKENSLFIVNLFTVVAKFFN